MQERPHKGCVVIYDKYFLFYAMICQKDML